MKAHSYPLSLGQMPGSRLMSWDWPCWPCFVVFFIGPRYEPSMQRPFPVLLGSPHQPHSGCCKQWAHVCSPEQLGAKREETEKNKKKKLCFVFEFNNPCRFISHGHFFRFQHLFKSHLETSINRKRWTAAAVRACCSQRSFQAST